MAGYAVQRAKSATRYDGLTREHLETLADHAAEFWLVDDDNTERS